MGMASIRPWTFALMVVLAAIGIAACALTGGRSSDMPNLGISNSTTLVVTLVVNGLPVAEFPPGAGRPSVDASLPDLPWTVEARSASGRVLTSIQVKPGDVVSTINADGTGSSRGAIGRVDLSCGRLTIWAGDVEPSGPAAIGPLGTAGDCLP